MLHFLLLPCDLVKLKYCFISKIPNNSYFGAFVQFAACTQNSPLISVYQNTIQFLRQTSSAALSMIHFLSSPNQMSSPPLNSHNHLFWHLLLNLFLNFVLYYWYTVKHSLINQSGSKHSQIVKCLNCQHPLLDQ